MSFTRREFLHHSAAMAGWLAAGCGQAATLETQILVNHVGFTPGTGKRFLIPATAAVPFNVIESKSGKVVHQGTIQVTDGDLGHYGVGEFTELKSEGDYLIEAGDRKSQPFVISSTVYDSSIAKGVRYFATQRCGDSQTGYHAPCHLDDGRRSDNGQHQDVSGGWHDACDLRKWVDATIYGMIGLGRLLEIRPSSADAGRILEEMRWGNQYFRKMQEPDGYVMNFCGGDDGNRYTDNRIGNEDDRPIHVEACELPAQFQFAAAQAVMARLTRQSDPAYSASCEKAGKKCLSWCMEHRSPGAALSLSAAVIACIEMHRSFGGEALEQQTAKFLEKLVGLQATSKLDQTGSLSGFFLTAPDKSEPLRDIMHGNLPLLALCESLGYFPSHPDAKRWRESLKLHVAHLLDLTSRSPFGIIPYGLYSGRDPGGGRKIGDYWYRYFMKDQNETAAGYWWVGINAHLASNGVGLVKAGRLLEDSKLISLAQRQLDWILGVNPFDASTVTDVGRNQPRLYRTTTFSPNTPEIPGGVTNGIGGTADDQPRLDAGSWNTCEYWTPMVAYTHWLMAELQRAER